MLLVSVSPPSLHEHEPKLRQFCAIDERTKDYKSPGYMINKMCLDNFAKPFDKLSKLFQKWFFYC